PVGEGRLTVSGAMDAWRFRSNGNEAFDRFWQAAVYGLSTESRPPIDVAVSPSVVAPGGRIPVHVRIPRHALASGPLGFPPGVRLAGSHAPVRLWPDATPDAYHASLVASTRLGVDRIDVTLGDRTGHAAFLVARNARTPREAPPLSLLAQSHGGIDVTAD